MQGDCGRGGKKHQHFRGTGFNSVLGSGLQGIAICYDHQASPLAGAGGASRYSNSENSRHRSLAIPLSSPPGKQINAVHPQDYGDLCFAHLPLFAPVSDSPLWLRLSWALVHRGSHCRTLQRQSCYHPQHLSSAALAGVRADSVLTKGNFLCFSVGNQWRISDIVSLFNRQKLRGSTLHVEDFTVQLRVLYYTTKALGA